MPRAGSPYGRRYQRERLALLTTHPRCALRLVCDGAPAAADSTDHDPPLALHRHVEGTSCCRLVPACTACQRRQGGLIIARRWPPRRQRIPPPSRAW